MFCFFVLFCFEVLGLFVWFSFFFNSPYFSINYHFLNVWIYLHWLKHLIKMTDFKNSSRCTLKKKEVQRSYPSCPHSCLHSSRIPPPESHICYHHDPVSFKVYVPTGFTLGTMCPIDVDKCIMTSSPLYYHTVCFCCPKKPTLPVHPLLLPPAFFICVF